MFYIVYYEVNKNPSTVKYTPTIVICIFCAEEFYRFLVAFYIILLMFQKHIDVVIMRKKKLIECSISVGVYLCTRDTPKQLA